MSLSLTLACLWALAATIVALLPYRRQFPPGIALLLAAPFVIGFVAWEHGALWMLLALAGFVSMFRRPLWFLGRRALGLDPGGPRRGGPRREPPPEEGP
ncbi:MAG: DUF2484 family protein [Rhodobacteraceae bacterium]|nr:DUF2484 family protein [Paracoccaceae bacterium]